MSMLRVLVLLAVGGVAFIGPANAAILTGAGISATGSAGAFTGVYWNTVLDDNYADLFLTGGPFGTSLNLGDNVYTIVAQPGYIGQGYYGLNLFFEGDGNTPLISALLTLPSGLSANGNADTFILLGDNGGIHVGGANTLSFTQGTTTVVLTALSVTEAVGNLTGSMTLHVTDTAIPEPPTKAAALLGLAFLILFSERRHIRGIHIPFRKLSKVAVDAA